MGERMKYAVAILTIIITTPAMAKDRCLAPDCSWLNTTNGKLYAAGPIRHGAPYYWKGWPAYDAMMCKRYGECKEKRR